MATNGEAATVKHPEFSSAEDDVHIWLRAENVLFCVHKSMLNSKSPLFKDLLTLPPPPGVCQGGSEDTPIFLPTVRAEQLELLLGIVYWSYEREKKLYTLEELLGVLELSSMLLVPDCRSKALDLLSWREVPAAKQLQVAMDCQIPAWVTPAFRQLIDRYEQITLADAVILGPTLFHHVSMTCHILTQCRQAVVAFAGEFKSNKNCETPDACHIAFRQLADSGFARLYNNPDSPMHANDALSWFENQPKGELCTWCWSTKQYTLEHEDVGGVTVFALEEKVFSDAAQDLLNRMAPFQMDTE